MRSVVYSPFVHQQTSTSTFTITITMATNALNEYDKADTTTDDIPQGGDTVDNSYATSKNEAVPVLTDETPVEQPNDTRDPDSDKALEQDEAEAIDESNIIKGRTRHAKPTGTYREPGDEEGLPGPDDGTSSTR
ncbi:histone chaperone CHZ domain-containing protein [Rutstroemia sp. NJR-2017a BVV2]|nr:histone chaperone CHZ domain-containing protein [Rutstroemia sp. NJR-2017a BVV2]